LSDLPAAVGRQASPPSARACQKSRHGRMSAHRHTPGCDRREISPGLLAHRNDKLKELPCSPNPSGAGMVPPPSFSAKT